MERRPLRALLERLNDCVGVSARRIFTQQVATVELLQRPQPEIRRLLPELCSFVDSLVSTSSTNSTTTPPSDLVRRAFQHPDAQWLSRSARQSGISSLLCQQLVRLARQESRNDNTIDNSGKHRSAAELTVQILLDALLSPCAQRLGQCPDACKWRPTQSKPRFHAMTCFPVWSSLQPFAVLMGLRFPDVFERVLEDHRHPQKKTKKHRVNCDFATVTGVWRLVEEMDRGDKEKQEKVTQVMAGLVRLVSDKLLGNLIAAKDAKKTTGAHLDDQLLEKFFTGLEGFAFKSWRASAVLKPALFGALEGAMTGPAGRTKAVVVPQRVGVFAAVGCMFVRDLAADVVSMLVENVSDTANASEEVREALLTFVTGLCAHLDLVPLTSVLELLELLVASYKISLQNTDDSKVERQRRLEVVFYVVYVTLHRCQSVDILRQEVGSEASAIMENLAQFQMRLCSDIAFEDYYVAAPAHWTAKIWKHWVFLSDEEVQAFVTEARENDNDTEQEFKDRDAAWQALEDRLPFTPSSCSPYTQMNTLLKPHLISSTPLTDPIDEYGLPVKARKRRRTGDLPKNNVDPEQLERSFDVLLLPDVMERVCSYMSAKRLCRMALVCSTFAEVSRRDSLWHGLYMRVGVSVGKKPSALPPSVVKCSHGGTYEHDWRQLYQERSKVLRKLRRMQRRAIETKQCNEQEDHSNNIEPNTTSMFIPVICSRCSCDHMLKTATELETHEALHKRFTCTEPSCRASFLGPQKFKAHEREHGIENTSTTGRLACGYPNCPKTYASAKRLATHRQKEGHTLQ